MIFSTFFFLSGYGRTGGKEGGVLPRKHRKDFSLKKKRRKGEEKENISRNDCSINKT